jgi:hypothetical protein
MSMERNFQKIKVEPIPEDKSMPAFLKKTDSVTSESSEPGVEGELARKLGGVTGIRDEGLGESFDQQSEVSDGSSNSRVGNGNGARNMTIRTVIEENTLDEVSESNLNHKTRPSKVVSPEDVTPELTLDPSKLPNFSNNSNRGDTTSTSLSIDSNLSAAADDLQTPSPRVNKKLNSAHKKVSFLGSNDSNDQDVIEDNPPVSDTYIYDDKPAKSGWGFLKKRAKAK